MSNTGRHFTPPSPAFRQKDPFSTHVPMSAEKVPSCRTSSPMEMDESKQLQPVAEKPFVIHTPQPTVIFDSKIAPIPTKTISKIIKIAEKPIKKESLSSKKPSSALTKTAPIERVNLAQTTKSPSQAKTKTIVKESPKGNFYRLCEWEKCKKKFLVKNSGRSASKRYCSATCRGRASESRKSGK